MWEMKKQILSGDTLSSTEEFKINKIRDKKRSGLFYPDRRFFRKKE